MIIVVLLGLSVAADASMVSFANGVTMRKLKIGVVLFVTLFFGVMQGLMPLIGYFLSDGIIHGIDKWSGLVVMLVLVILGLKMLLDGYNNKKELDKKSSNDSKNDNVESSKNDSIESGNNYKVESGNNYSINSNNNCRKGNTQMTIAIDSDNTTKNNTTKKTSLLGYCIQGVATSIDALIVGVGLASIDFNVYWAVATISIITFCLAFSAWIVGWRLGSVFKKEWVVNVIAGLLLIGLGVWFMFK